MKKKLLLALCTIFLFAAGLHARNLVVSSVLEFKTAWANYLDGDTISVQPNGGMVYNQGEIKLHSNGGCVTVRSANPDSLAFLQLQVTGVTLSDTSSCGLVFENLHLEYRTPQGTSGQIIYFNSVWANISKLIFRGCEITQSVRSVFRSVKPSILNPKTGLSYNNSGILNYFEMSGCKVHNSFLSSAHNWPMIYPAHLPVTVTFKNNTFYDLPFLKNLFLMGPVVADTTLPTTFGFENNTVCIRGPYNGQSLISTSNILKPDVVFNLKNNLLLLPNWVNDKNPADSGFLVPKLINVNYGIVHASHNLIQGYGGWTSGKVPGVDEPFIELDTLPQFTMDGLGVQWSDFANPQAGDFSYLASNPLASAGENGAPIGDKRWAVGALPKIFHAVANIPGAVLSPSNTTFAPNTLVKVTASSVIGYRFLHWADSMGVVVSESNPMEFTITSDTKLTAVYEALPVRKVSVQVYGSSTGTCSIQPARAEYYEGDLLTITANEHAVNDFVAWSDGFSDQTRTFLLGSDDLNLKAYFIEKPFFLAWDFCQVISNLSYSTLPPNHWKDSVQIGQLKAKTKDTVDYLVRTRYNKWMSPASSNAIYRYTTSANLYHPDWVYVQFNTTGMSHIKVHSRVAAELCAFQSQLMQVSLDKRNWSTFANLKFSENVRESFGKWTDFDGLLPDSAANRETVYVRWVGDLKSNLIADSLYSLIQENFYISEIVLSNDSTFQPNPVTPKLYSDPVSVTSGGTFLLPIQAALPSDSIISYQFDLEYDPTRLQFLGVGQENTLSDQSVVLVNTNVYGRIRCAYTSTNYLKGQGVLLNLKFKALTIGECLPILSKSYFNSNVVDDVRMSVITIYNKFGDVNGDDLVLAHDAGLVLQYSVSMDPLPYLDPLPWDAWRLTVADVDGSKMINAYDAGLILQRSIDLIPAFPVETSLRSAAADAVNKVSITQEGRQLVLRSHGAILGLNVNIANGASMLDEPKNIASAYMAAKNINGQVYRIGMATATPIPDESVLMVLPIKENVTTDLIVQMIVNNEFQDLKANIVTDLYEGVAESPLLYPNPAGAVVHLSGITGTALFTVMDLNGRELLRKEVLKDQAITVSELSGGVYLYKVQSGEHVYRGKLVKQ
jgi:hypothetical protein